MRAARLLQDLMLLQEHGRLSARRLSYLSDAVARAVERAPGRADRMGWRQVTIPIESAWHASLELQRVGAECQVIAPAELRERMAENAAALSRIYRRARK